MNMETEVKHIIAKKLNVKENRITSTALFVEDLGADSLDKVELIMAFEDKFDIEINDDDIEKILSVQDALNYISKKV